MSADALSNSSKRGSEKSQASWPQSSHKLSPWWNGVRKKARNVQRGLLSFSSWNLNLRNVRQRHERKDGRTGREDASSVHLAWTSRVCERAFHMLMQCHSSGSFSISPVNKLTLSPRCHRTKTSSYSENVPRLIIFSIFWRGTRSAWPSAKVNSLFLKCHHLPPLFVSGPALFCVAGETSNEESVKPRSGESARCPSEAVRGGRKALLSGPVKSSSGILFLCLAKDCCKQQL